MLIKGARRVGKSTLVKDFGEHEYRSYILIDFFVASKEVKDLFETKRDDIDSFFLYLSTYYGVRLYVRDTLIIFDEVQLFPLARGFIKHLVADGRYDFIETGSLISIKRNTEGILIPSEEEAFELNPFDFEEFLWALGEDILVELLSKGLDLGPDPLPSAIHRKAMSLFREYMLVGGMPQAITKYVETRSFEETDRVKRRILELYRNDIERYAQGDASRIISIFKEIPAQLSRPEKKFVLASLNKNARMRRYEDAFFWLEDAKIVNLCMNSTDPNVGLGLNRERTTLKCYMADTGLLITQVFADQEATSQQIYRDVLFDKLGVNEGMIMENMVAQILHASGHELYFYSRSDREKPENTMEVDFLIVAEGGPHAKICPIEVKSGKRYKTRSLDKFGEKFKKRVGDQYVVHTGNLKVEGGRIWIPLYLLPWLRTSMSRLAPGD